MVQILPDGDKKPQVKQLQTRAEYMLKLLKKQLDGGTPGPKAAPVSNNFLVSKLLK